MYFGTMFGESTLHLEDEFFNKIFDLVSTVAAELTASLDLTPSNITI